MFHFLNLLNYNIKNMKKNLLENKFDIKIIDIYFIYINSYKNNTIYIFVI